MGPFIGKKFKKPSSDLDNIEALSLGLVLLRVATHWELT